MAEGTKLQLTFETNESKTTTMTFAYAKPNATASDVRALMNAIVTNGEIFENVPVTPKSAKTITTSENVYDLSDLSRETPYTSTDITALEKGLITHEEYIAACERTGTPTSTFRPLAEGPTYTSTTRRLL